MARPREGIKHCLTWKGAWSKGRICHIVYEGEVASTTTYLLNKSPTRALQNYTSEKAWSKIKPSAKHQRIFGSVCYKHVPNERRNKLDDKSETFILIGYHPTSAYKLYSLEKNQVMIGRYILVDEAATFNWVEVEAGLKPDVVVSS